MSDIKPNSSFLQLCSTFFPIPLSIIFAIREYTLSVAGLQRAEALHVLQNPMDSIMWAKEMEAVHQKMLTDAAFASVAIILAGIIVSILLHQVYFARRLTKAAKTIEVPTSLSPAVNMNVDEITFKSYLRVFEQIAEAGKSRDELASVDFHRLSVGRTQFITFRSWPVWSKHYPLGKWVLIACAFLDLLLDPAITGIVLGLLFGLAVASEFIIKNRGYFETEMRKFISAGSNNPAGKLFETPDNVAGKVSRLYELKQNGALTQEEFDQEKAKVLRKAA